MAIGFKKNKYVENNDNIFWTTMSDLMLGLSIIFMTLFTLAMTGFTQDSVKLKQEQIEISKNLAENLANENINAQVDNMTGDLKISDLELFEVNSWTLSNKGKKYLDKLIPVYVNTIFSNDKFINDVDKIVIQGHTDSQSFKGISKDEQFTKNMELSLKRANSVAEYVFKTNYNKSYNDKLRKMLIVEGYSFNAPILDNGGNEDFSKSRRVELKLKVKNTDISKAFGF